MRNIKAVEEKLERICHACNGTTTDNKGEVCIPCRGEGVLTEKDNKRLALLWQAANSR